jgi:hypothetical protein
MIYIRYRSYLWLYLFIVINMPYCGWDYGSAVEHLSDVVKSLGSIPITIKKKKSMYILHIKVIKYVHAV